MAEAAWRLDRRPLGYRAAWALQRELVSRRQRDEIPDLLLLTEHPPVFTLGRTARREHLLGDPARLGAEVVETDRGGDVTFHGPGQLVAYPILDLAGWRKDVHAYLRALEAVGIGAAARCGVEACRREGFTGAWCGARKLASIGVRVTRWVASHGVAINVTTDLEWFERIVPCGIRGSAPTSLEAETGRPLTMDTVADRVADAFAAVFGRRLTKAPPAFTATLDRRAAWQPVDRAPRMGIRPRRDGKPHRPGGCGALSPPDGPNRLRDPFRPLSRGGRTLPGGASRRVGARGTSSTA